MDNYLEIVKRIKGKKALVIGDIMVDEYFWGKVDRISPEAPVPVVKIVKETRTLGGAGNVALNAKKLGIEVILSGLIGDDYYGRNIEKALKQHGISSKGIVKLNTMSSIVKTRIIAHNQQVVRIDREDNLDLPTPSLSGLRKRILSHMKKVDVVMISDYNKGSVTKSVFETVIKEAKKRKIPVIVDPKKRDVSFYKGCTVLKPNRNEAELFSGIDIEEDSDIMLAGRRIIKKSEAEAVLITMGEKGMALVRRGRRKAMQIDAIEKGVFDVTGAGDTVLTTFSATLAAGGTLEEATVLSNIAAAVVVSEVGTSPITDQKLERALHRYESNTGSH